MYLYYVTKLTETEISQVLSPSYRPWAFFLLSKTDKAERLLAEASGYGSQVVVFPEAFIGGYPRGTNFGVSIANRTAKGKEDFRKYHASAIDVPG